MIYLKFGDNIYLMGYVGFLEKKIKAQTLRKKGLSYREIQKIIPVSKSTLSDWCRDLAITKEQALRLFKNKLKGSAKGRIIGAKKQQEKRIKQIEKLLIKGKKQVGRLNKRERFVSGIALYAAEGTKGERMTNFCNSDPATNKFMMNWFREFCKVPIGKFRGAIWIHEGRNKRKAVKFWSTLTGIPTAQFNKTYVAKDKTGSHKIRKKKHQYGIFSIRFSDVKIQRLIMGWIGGLLKNSMI